MNGHERCVCNECLIVLQLVCQSFYGDAGKWVDVCVSDITNIFANGVGQDGHTHLKKIICRPKKYS